MEYLVLLFLSSYQHSIQEQIEVFFHVDTKLYDSHEIVYSPFSCLLCKNKIFHYNNDETKISLNTLLHSNENDSDAD